jgi:ethanolamine ammonia-lyase small subunit
MSDARGVRADPWARLRQFTRARIGLEPCGASLSTADLLKFQLDHAHARDAVHGSVDFDALAARLRPEHDVICVHSAAPDRLAYLRRPDLGRRLDTAGGALLAAHATTPPCELVLVIADGLSSAAINEHAVTVAQACMARLSGWRIAPVVLAQQARVGLGDAIAAHLNADACAVLIGERPGLSVSDSLGIYLTWQPRDGHRDADRNCISNIHAHGLSSDAAADKTAWLLHQMRRLRLSGTALKDDPAAIEQFRLALAQDVGTAD